MRLIFMGTPDFAVGTLTALYEAGHEILAAVSQPDKPRGRHGSPVPTPVKEKAMELHIPVLQPVTAKDPAFIEEIRALSPDVIVVTAYGQILRKELLDIPKQGCINVHASLLPRWRGAAPIQWAIIEGDEKSGVTTMMMDEGLDTGDMLLKKELPISDTETGESLFEKLSQLGGELIVETLKRLEEGSLERTPQPEAGMTYAKMLRKEQGKVDFMQDAKAIERLVRGLYPWPGSYTYLSGKLLKLHRTEAVSEAALSEEQKKLSPGSVIPDQKELMVRCKEGALRLLELQLEGKRRMSAEEFLRGSKAMLEGAGNRLG